MEYLINTGLASQFFVTDPDKVVTVIQSPIILRNDAILDMNSIKENFPHCVDAFAARGSLKSLLLIFFNIGAKVSPGSSEAIQKTNLWLQNELHDYPGKNRISGRMLKPLFIIANGINAECLSMLKKIKIRGAEVYAIDASKSSETDRKLLLHSNIFDGKILHQNKFSTLVMPNQNITIISGLKMTVISSDSRIDDILAKYDGLTSKLEDLDNNETI